MTRIRFAFVICRLNLTRMEFLSSIERFPKKKIEQLRAGAAALNTRRLVLREQG
jgi:hypothetical protein